VCGVLQILGGAEVRAKSGDDRKKANVRALPASSNSHLRVGLATTASTANVSEAVPQADRKARVPIFSSPALSPCHVCRRSSTDLCDALLPLQCSHCIGREELRLWFVRSNCWRGQSRRLDERRHFHLRCMASLDYCSFHGRIAIAGGGRHRKSGETAGDGSSQERGACCLQEAERTLEREKTGRTGESP